MKMIPDRTGRFPKRPYWETAELEGMCEEAITAFLHRRYGFDRIPVPTEAITALIERDAGDLDVRSDLSDDEYEVFGYTIFQRGQKPRVVIARELWEQRHRSNRLRMTLGHEYGHLLLHTWLYDQYGPQTNRSAAIGAICFHASGWLTGRNGKPGTQVEHS